ncbi:MULTISPECIES: glycerophosphodiester phosphodiesterase family protein [unclassified Ornithinimicrobium]|uniref:glycerophosphodiester phosphodiesterase family protein n=1 Tax=unclassified Ornithinimicrobium TaxID=2615080 RepID=UPI0038529DA3
MRTPVVIAHRGACGYLPEHTLAAYELAARQGADLLEPDVVATRDGVLVVRHENEISGTTDVATRPELAHRRTTRTVDGVEVTGWFTEDLTLAELRTLRAVERLPHLRPASAAHDRDHAVPTLAELLVLRARLSEELGREIGVYVETKHPTHFASLGLPLEEPLLEALRAAGLDDPRAPAFVQSFEPTGLRRLRHGLGARVRQVLLAAGWDEVPHDLVAAGTPQTCRELLTPVGLRALRGDVDAIGPDKRMVLDRTSDDALGRVTPLLAQAHEAGLLVHPWTFRAENVFLPRDLRTGTAPEAHGRLDAELTAYLEAGVDGFFTDHPDVGVAVRDRHLEKG